MNIEDLVIGDIVEVNSGDSIPGSFLLKKSELSFDFLHE
jgi:magnesium-transporting ATPase (P-type)